MNQFLIKLYLLNNRTLDYHNHVLLKTRWLTKKLINALLFPIRY